ncbi:hypothetical protein [Streptomyces toxytricini]|uniref:hypothetical protein n=1 Tax=Streptomyces toxytricini TaxID=67369 RepID=UPI00344876ED
MTAAGTAFRAPWIRIRRIASAPLWLALLLVGFLCAHGGETAGAAHHVRPAATALVSAPAAPSVPDSATGPVARAAHGDRVHGGGGAGHQGEHCAPGRTDGSAVLAGCPDAPAGRPAAPADSAAAPAAPGRPQTQGAVPPRTPGVLRI